MHSKILMLTGLSGCLLLRKVAPAMNIFTDGALPNLKSYINTIYTSVEICLFHATSHCPPVAGRCSCRCIKKLREV